LGKNNKTLGKISASQQAYVFYHSPGHTLA
jgi:hypothetical protein